MKYRAVIFDLGGTLYPETPRSEKDRIVALMAAELPVPSGEFTRLWNAGFSEQMNGGLVNCQGCVRNICNQLGSPVSGEQVIAASRIFLDSVRQTIKKPRGDASPVISELKRRRLKIGLISNAAMDVANSWELSPVAPLFDVVTFSCSVHLRKPDPQIYLLTLKKLGVRAGKCIYVADGKYKELSGAANLGMTVLQLRAPRETDADSERQVWNGPRISSLRGLLDLLE